MHNRVTVPQFGRVIVYATILLIAVLPNTASNHAPQPGMAGLLASRRNQPHINRTASTQISPHSTQPQQNKGHVLKFSPLTAHPALPPAY